MSNNDHIGEYVDNPSIPVGRHTGITIGYRSQGLVNPPKITGWPNGWYEYTEPLQYGYDGRSIRRFYKNKEGFEIATNETMPFSIFNCETMPIDLMCQYVTKEGKIFFASEEVMFPEEYDHNAEMIIYDKIKHIPVDQELLDAFSSKKKMKDIMFDMYGAWSVYTGVKDEEEAFLIGDILCKRVQNSIHKNILLEPQENTI